MGMTIKRLELRNFQAIKDFSADFTGDVYLVKGENEVGKFTISVFDETMDNVFTASTIGQLVIFLNLCGLQKFTSTLKM